MVERVSASDTAYAQPSGLTLSEGENNSKTSEYTRGEGNVAAQSQKSNPSFSVWPFRGVLRWEFVITNKENAIKP